MAPSPSYIVVYCDEIASWIAKAHPQQDMAGIGATPSEAVTHMELWMGKGTGP